MGRIGNAWEIAKASWRVLAKDRELVAMPVIAGLVALVVFGIMAGAGAVLMAGNQAGGTGEVATWLILFAAAVAATWVGAIGQAAVIAGAAERMDGGDPTLSSAFAVARARVVRLLQWAVLATVVAVVLDQLEERLGVLGRLVSWAGGIAFRVMSFLALPVIVFEDVGAIEGFKRSSRLLKETWGEQITFNFGLGILTFVAFVPGVLVAALLVATSLTPLVVIGIIVAAVWIITVAAVTSALSAVFKTALYRWATGAPVDPTFDRAQLDAAFRRR